MCVSVWLYVCLVVYLSVFAISFPTFLLRIVGNKGKNLIMQANYAGSNKDLHLSFILQIEILCTIDIFHV